MPKISEILGVEKFNGLISAGASDEEIELIARKARKKQLEEQNNSNTTLTPGQSENPILDNDNILTQTVRGLADTGFRIAKAADYASEYIGFDLISDKNTDFINKEQEKIDAAKKRVSQAGLSKERLAEITALENDSANASGTWENVKAGVNQMVDVATHPGEWTTQGVVETIIDPLNAISFGAGGVAAKAAKTLIGKAFVGGTVGATEGAVVNSAYEYAVAKGGNVSDEEAKKIAIQSAAGGAAAGATFGAIGGVTFRQKKAAQIKDKSTKDILENDLLKIDEADEVIETANSKPTSIMDLANNVLSEYDLESKNVAMEAITNDELYKKLPKDLKEQVNKLREYEAYQESLNPDKKAEINPLDDVKQKILSAEEIAQRLDDSFKSMPEVKPDEMIDIDVKYQEVQNQYKTENVFDRDKQIKRTDFTPDFTIIHENLPAQLRELVDTEIIEPEAAAQIEYKQKVLQLQNKGVIYSNFEGWSENVGQNIVDAINAKKINDLQRVEVESNTALEAVVKLQDELTNEGATPGQIKEIVNKKFLPTKLEQNISNSLNDGQPLENRYAGFRLRELTNKTIDFLENPDIQDLKIKLQNANLQADLQKAVLDSVMNKDINILDQFISEKLTQNVKESNDVVKAQLIDKLQAQFKKEDSTYQANLQAKNKIDFENYQFNKSPKDFVVNDLSKKVNQYIEETPGTKEFLEDTNQVQSIKEMGNKFDDKTLSKYLPEEKSKLDFIRAKEMVDNLSKKEEVPTLEKFDEVTKMLEEGC